MIADLKPYPAMQDSCVPWLGKVPEHWGVRRIKTLFREKDERSGSGDGVLLSLTRARGIVPQTEASNRIASAEDLSKYKVCRPGDLVMNRMQAWSGMFAVSTYAGLVSPDYSVFGAIDTADVKFFEHLFKTPLLVDQFAQHSKGIGSGFNRLYTPDFGAVPAVVPPLPEQAAIVHFLNHADRRIRRYIGAKQKLIKLLEEQKQAIIHRAVTHGLDPNVRLKPSGVEWLGDVPEHWQLLPLKRACSLLRDGTHLPPPRQAEGFPLLSVRNVVNGSFVRRPDDSRISESHFYDLCRSFTPQRDDVVLAIVGATLGKVAIVPEMEPFQIQRSLAVLRPRTRLLDFRFLAAFLRGPGFQRALWTTVAFSAQPGIYLNTLCSFCVALPPISEQQTIIAELDCRTEQLARAIVSAHREIDLLREYRIRLIADVVTGKLDVREAEARLAEEAEEPELLDEADAITDGEEDAAEDLDAAPGEAEA